MTERKLLPSSVWAGLAALLFIMIMLAFAAWGRVFRCPGCIDLECAVFHCELCDGSGGPRNAKRMSLWKRWKSIQALEREGSRKIRLIP